MEYSPKDLYHVFNKQRPGQLRGVPWLSPAMVRLKDIDEFIGATIMKQKIAACFAGFLTDMNVDLVNEEIYNQQDAEFSEKIEPGIIEQLPTGKNITFTDPPDTESFKDFISSTERGIANAVGLSYEALTGDLSGVNFSSARMGWLEMNRDIEAYRRKVLIDGFVVKVVKDFISTYELTNGVMLTGLDFEFIEPKREMIDPIKETKALISAVRAGFLSLDEAITSLGRNPDKVFEQIGLDNKKLEDLGLTLDTDTRKKEEPIPEGGKSNSNT